MNVANKKCVLPVTVCIIYDRAWPPRDSVNDHIDLKSFYSYCASSHDAVCLLKQQGVGTLSAKLNLTDAFKSLSIHMNGHFFVLHGNQSNPMAVYRRVPLQFFLLLSL